MSDRKLISSGSPFEKANGYSRAVVVGDEVHIAGTTGYDYAKMAMPDDVAEQTRNIYATFAKVMKEAFEVPGVGRIVMLLEPGGAGIGWMTPSED